MTEYKGIAIFVKDIDISKSFYLNVLNLSIEMDFGKNVILNGGITLWEVDSDNIIPESLGIFSMRYNNVNRFELYFETNDIISAQQKIKASGAEFLHDIHEEIWGQRTLRFFDPDRHLIEIGESLNTFVLRLYNENMTAEKIAEKTSIPFIKVNEIIKDNHV